MEEYNEIEDVAYEIESKLLGTNNKKAITCYMHLIQQEKREYQI